MPFDHTLALFWLKKLVSTLALPPLAPILLMAVGLIVLRSHRRTGFVLAWLGVASAILLSSAPSVGWLAGRIEPQFAVTTEAAARAEAIVILGGGRRRHAPEYGGETVNRLTLERLRYGARLARDTGLPILVSGGAPSGDAPEADLMQAALEIDFNMPVRWVERASLDTRQNAQLSAVPLNAAGVKRIVLVTHAIHMPRASAEFAAQGFDVVAAPTGWLGNPERIEFDLGLLPSASSAYSGWLAAHEWLGQLAYQLTR